MQLADSAPLVSRLLGHREPRVRLAAIGAAKELRAAMAMGALRSALADSEREVRIAAARVLGELQYQPAAPFLRAAIESKDIRQADISEQIAFFESYGMIRDPDGVRFLDGLLNGRRFFGKKESGEIRACAALGLGKIGTPEAMLALEKAAAEPDPVVRSAVNRALRGEGGDHE
jgi:HEAT repeat protein